MQERALLLIPRSGTASHVCHACLEPMMPAKAQKGPGGAEDGTSNPLLPRYCSRACAAPRLLRDGHLLPLRRGLADISREHGVDPELLHLRPAPWRGALGPALRAVHAELAALAAGGKLAGYAAPGTLPELQARAAMLATNLVGTGPSTEAGLALFPGLASFSHSCMPNCIWIAAGDTVYVRTVTPIKAGEPLTLSFAPLYEPRSVRKQTLAMERGVSCACTRCVSPLATSSDRFLEEEGMPAGEETPVAGHESVPSTPRPGAADSPPAAEAQAADHSQCCGGHGDHSHHHHAPPPLTFPGKWWKCCGCGSVAPGVAEQGLGPQQLVQRADLLWQQGLMLHNMKVDGGGKAYSQSEQILRVLCAGLAGRLHPLHARVIDALTPLLNINATHANSSVVRKQFDRKYKLAHSELVFLRKMMLGPEE
ncbi:Putative SET domain-containing protein L678 [Auxenochlorella protothecoides]|uniref:Putative SET domain-containing protein L678 n=1 Tax=Auxenochlorella protothecoides TaxID=3075 RepID=A0A087SS23_AUXPR|nr:Putative SET domain-containing protein L678 [Auxenochlorella protothecoides]KFM28527.1 Putative SET domain-containing protein L678 [Auxenochlorella protothecoides]